MNKLISIIIPVYNEEKNIPVFYEKFSEVISNIKNYDFEIIFVNDGSQDKSLEKMEALSQRDPRIKIIDFSRNFGKEAAITAGINSCLGDACMMADADLQHPLEKIPEFIAKWEKGTEIVIGVRERNKGEGLIKRIGSYLFYKIINRISEMEIVSKSTDFRLLDRIVIDEFKKFTETNRMARALIDWLGFKRGYIYFKANPRLYGKPTYGFLKLTRLAFNSMVSLSLFPLKVAGYLGVTITIISGLIGIFIFFTKYIFGSMDYSWPAILALVNLFLIGIVLSCLGLIALYIANIHTEVTGRPMYIIRKKNGNRQ